MKIRPYQQQAVDYIEQRLWTGEHFRTCLSAPTGSGKTIILAEILRTLPVRQLVITHRRVLLDQTAKVLKAHGVDHGFIASGFKPKPSAIVQLAMIQTLLRRSERVQLDGFYLVHVDEVHCQTGPQYANIFERLYQSGACFVGYTATPSDLGGIVDGVFQVVSVSDLIEQGYLCQPRVFSCGQPDVKLLERMRRGNDGEYLATDVNQVVRPHLIFGHVLEHYKRLSPDNRSFILFAHSVKASRWWAQKLTAEGIPTAHIDGDNVWLEGQFYTSDSSKRNEVFRRIESGNLRGVSNRFVLREGFDCPAIGHAILTCPVGRRRTYTQMCGRVLRPYPGRDYAIIQDHSGSSIQHPPLDSDAEWYWSDPPGLAEKTHIAQMRANEEPEPIVCPKCTATRFAGDTCPYCGFAYRKHARWIIQVDGTLRLIEGRSYRPRQIRSRPNDAATWERLYWKTVKNGARTAEQAYAYYAYSNNWRWLPRTLPLMPREQADWFRPLRDIPKSRLHS